MQYRSMDESQLAERSGVNRSTINRILNGVTVPQVTLVKRIAEALGMTVDDAFFFRVDQVPEGRVRDLVDALVDCCNDPPDAAWRQDRSIRTIVRLACDLVGEAVPEHDKLRGGQNP